MLKLWTSNIENGKFKMLNYVCGAFFSASGDLAAGRAWQPGAAARGDLGAAVPKGGGGARRPGQERRQLGTVAACGGLGAAATRGGGAQQPCGAGRRVPRGCGGNRIEFGL